MGNGGVAEGASIAAAAPLLVVLAATALWLGVRAVGTG